MNEQFVRIFEVGPRDGLQNEKDPIPTVDKIRLVDLLSAANLPNIEVTSFVSPKWVPNMADAAAVLAGIKRAPGIRYSALVPNLKGFEAAVACGVDEIAVFASASETFSEKNINCTITESLDRFAKVIGAAKACELPVRGYVSCVTDCPYEGRINPENVARVTQALLQMGCYEVSLGDTLGRGTVATIRAMLRKVLEIAPVTRLAGHYHDTGGNAIVNIEASLEMGLRCFDASIGGLGGCPYAPGAKGNAATEKVVRHLNKQGYQTGIDLGKLGLAKDFVDRIRNRPKMGKPS